MKVARAHASSPGGIGNIGPGLDVLGCALTGAHDEVFATATHDAIVRILDAGHPDLSTSPEQHTSGIAATAVIRLLRQRDLLPENAGVDLVVKKGLPLAGGQGGSAASAVAGAAATNALFGNTLSTDDLLACALDAEATVAGRHLDNIASALLGGIVLVRSLQPMDVVRLPVPDGMGIVLAHPSQRLSTAAARSALPEAIPLALVTHQLAQVAAMVSACWSGDLALFGRSIDDRIAEPARAPLIPGFADAKQAALHAGALGASISGAGPTTFAVVDAHSDAEMIAGAMQQAYAAHGVTCTTRIATIDVGGTTVIAA